MPIHWDRMSDDDVRKMMITTTGDATEHDIALLNDMSGDSAAAGSADVGVKQEPETDIAKLQRRSLALTDDAQTHLRKHQDMETELRVIQANSKQAGTKYVGELVEDIKKKQTRVGKLIKIIEKIVTDADKANKVELPNVVQTMDQVDKFQNEIHEWAARFGLIGAKKRRTKKQAA